MKKTYLLFVYFICLQTPILLVAQESDIVSIIDRLTVEWDQTAIDLRDYQGIQNFCARADYKQSTLHLLDAIHHWDTTLYFIVQEKFDIKKDKEAAATLSDIIKLETDYTTEKFKEFISNECDMLKSIDESFGTESIKKYEKEVRDFEKELKKYLTNITYRIDIIDEHIHHLTFD